MERGLPHQQNPDLLFREPVRQHPLQQNKGTRATPPEKRPTEAGIPEAA